MPAHRAKKGAPPQTSKASPPLPAALRISLDAYLRLVPHRNARLFTEFLPAGYRLMTLSSVDPKFREPLLTAKLHLGLLITLYDDLADHPEWANPRLLHELYKLPFHAEAIRLERLSAREREVVALAMRISEQTFPILVQLPHFSALGPALRFDLHQFFVANRYSELVTQSPFLANTLEGALYINHNMGMMIIGTMDLMATSDLDFNEVGAIRSLFSRGQRVGRICNVLATLRRELKEGDLTNELILAALERRLLTPELVRSRKAGSFDFSPFITRLKSERGEILEELLTERDTIVSFDVEQYVGGLRGVQRLHESLEGVI